jgi:hypothetical protein
MKCSSIFNLVLIFMSSACAHTLPDGADFLRIRGDQPRTEHSNITISSAISYFDNKELSHKSLRKLSLKIKSELIPTDNEQEFIVRNTTVEKRGEGDLHHFGFPEIHETIEIQLDYLGQVQLVKGQPDSSVFYLPPVLLPDYAVGPGSTWEDTYLWKGEGSSAPYFKTRIQCEFVKKETWKKRDVYRIRMIAETALNRFSSEVELTSRSDGYLLWDNKMGSVLYSESQGKDMLRSKRGSSHSETVTEYRSVLVF